MSAGRLAVKLASQAARFVLRELERFAGNRVLTMVSDFFAAAAESVDAVVDQLRKTEALMRSDAVRFVMVTTADEDRLRQASELIKEMKADGLALSAIVINRFLDERSLREGALELFSEIETLRDEFADQEQKGVGAVMASLDRYRARALADLARVEEFAARLPPEVTLAIAPELGIGGLHDLAALKRVAAFIMEGGDALQMVDKAAPQKRTRRAVNR